MLSIPTSTFLWIGYSLGVDKVVLWIVDLRNVITVKWGPEGERLQGRIAKMQTTDELGGFVLSEWCL